MSASKPQTADHQRKPKQVAVGMAVIRSEGSTTTCSCGWVKNHRRLKVREDSAGLHVMSRHCNQALWL